MKRLALLQQAAAKAIAAYRAHAEAGTPAAEAEATAYAAETVKLKAAMEAAVGAVNQEREILTAEAAMTASVLDVGADPKITGGTDARENDPKRGFRTFGDFTRAVMQAGQPTRGKLDPRLLGDSEIGAAAPTTYGNEAVGADGGYLVPPEYSRKIFDLSLDEGNLLPLTMDLPVGGNSITFPVDETTPWGTDGIRMYYANEAGAATQTKPKLGERTLKLRKLLGLVPLTDELAADSLAAGAFVTKALGRSLAWKVNDGIVNGNGVQAPLGFRTAASIISQAAEAAQAADTINAANCAKMIGRLVNPSSSKIRWLVHPDALNQLVTMTIGNQPIWTPPNQGIQNAPAGFLLGRPIIISQVCQTLGDAGDILLANFDGYVSISKGPEMAESMHLFFDYGLNAFRLTFRWDGQPWLSAAVSPANGSSTLSDAVQLAARA